MATTVALAGTATTNSMSSEFKLHEKVFVIKTYYKYGEDIGLVRREFEREFRVNLSEFSMGVLYNLVLLFENTGTVTQSSYYFTDDGYYKHSEILQENNNNVVDPQCDDSELYQYSPHVLPPGAYIKQEPMENFWSISDQGRDLFQITEISSEGTVAARSTKTEPVVQNGGVTTRRGQTSESTRSRRPTQKRKRKETSSESSSESDDEPSDNDSVATEDISAHVQQNGRQHTNEYDESEDYSEGEVQEKSPPKRSFRLKPVKEIVRNGRAKIPKVIIERCSPKANVPNSALKNKRHLIYLGAKFASFPELQEALELYHKTHIHFKLHSMKTLDCYRRYHPNGRWKQINPALKYISVRYMCLTENKKISIAEHRCKAHLCARASECGQYLEITSLAKNHYHANPNRED